MYNNVLGVVSVRQNKNPALYDVFCDVSEICDQIIVCDPSKKLADNEVRMLNDVFEAEITDSDVSELEYDEYAPEWVFACYNDERPSRRFRYMKVGLCMNPFINVWTAKYRCLWEVEDQYRVDSGWSEIEKAFLYKYSHETNYKWGKGLIPINQPGPMESCMLDVYSYRYLDEIRRKNAFKDCLKHPDYYTNGQRRLLLSLDDSEIMISTAVN